MFIVTQKKRLAQWLLGLCGVCLASHSMGQPRDMKDIEIRADIQPGEGHYFDNKPKVLVSTPRFLRAFELVQLLSGLTTGAVK